MPPDVKPGTPEQTALRPWDAIGLLLQAARPERRSLLRAVVAHLSSGGTAGEGAVARAVRPASLSDAAYIGVIVAAAAWAIRIARPIFS